MAAAYDGNVFDFGLEGVAPKPVLKFGVELEFTIDDDRAGITNDGHPGEAQAHHLGQALSSNTHTQDLPIAFECQSCVWNDDDTVQLCVFCRRLGNANKIDRYTTAFKTANFPRYVQGTGYEMRVSHFIIKPEMSLLQMQDHQKTPLELATPRQNMVQAVRSDFKELRDVINGLGDLNWGIQFERTCGLHIHIGQQESMSLPFAKRLIAIVAILEDRLLRGSLVTAERKQSHDNAAITRHSSWMTRDFSPSGVDFLSRRARTTMPKEMKEFFSWPNDQPAAFYHDYANDQLHTFIMMVFKEKQIAGLAEGLTGHTRNCGLRMNIRPGEADSWHGSWRYKYRANNSTFEFRYPGATMDPRLIGLWVELCGAIVDLAWERPATRTPRLHEMFKIIDDARGQPAWSTQERDGLLKFFGQEHNIRVWNQLLGQLASNRDDSRDFYTRELIPQAGMLRK